MDLIDRAIELKYDKIAITEHLDLFPWELARYGLPSFSRYIKQVDSLKEQFTSAPLRIICGVEVGDFQRVKPFADEFLAQVEFELRLGAVHFLSDHTNVAIPLKRELTAADHEDYYRQNLALVTGCDIDVLAHLGVHKRYLEEQPDESHCRGLLTDIFQVMVERRIALEINFSSLRKPYARLRPTSGKSSSTAPWAESYSAWQHAYLLEHFDLNYEQLSPGCSPEMEFPSEHHFSLNALQV